MIGWNTIDDLFTLRSSQKHKLLKKSEVFCMAPWLQLHAQTDGKVSPCCMTSVHDGNEIGNLRENPNLLDSWNSENMKQLRQNMLKGEKSSLCNNCYKYEELGKFSERMQYNQDFKHYFKRIKSTEPDGTLKEDTVPIIDIRFSNKCNYKCRICNSDYSSLWYEEELKLGKGDPNKPKEMRVANDEAAFWKSYKSLLPDVKRLHFAGGEPLFMDEHYQILEHLISIGNTDVHLTYNTNFSTLRYKQHNVTELWNKFKTVSIWASLDGMEERGDYQRKGQKWKDIEENIRTVQQKCPHVFFGVNITVSLFNVLHIPAFYKHLVQNKFVKPDRVNLYPLFYPHAFTVTNLTPAIKGKALKQFDSFEKEFLHSLSGSSKIKDHIKAIVTYMLSEQVSRQKEFQEKINSVDEIRSEQFATTFPELSELMHTDNVSVKK